MPINVGPVEISILLFNGRPESFALTIPRVVRHRNWCTGCISDPALRRVHPAVLLSGSFVPNNLCPCTEVWSWLPPCSFQLGIAACTNSSYLGCLKDHRQPSMVGVRIYELVCSFTTRPWDLFLVGLEIRFQLTCFAVNDLPDLVLKSSLSYQELWKAPTSSCVLELDGPGSTFLQTKKTVHRTTNTTLNLQTFCVVLAIYPPPAISNHVVKSDRAEQHVCCYSIVSVPCILSWPKPATTRCGGAKAASQETSAVFSQHTTTVTFTGKQGATWCDAKSKRICQTIPTISTTRTRGASTVTAVEQATSSWRSELRSGDFRKVNTWLGGRLP